MTRKNRLALAVLGLMLVCAGAITFWHVMWGEMGLGAFANDLAPRIALLIEPSEWDPATMNWPYPSEENLRECLHGFTGNRFVGIRIWGSAVPICVGVGMVIWACASRVRQGAQV